MSRSVTRRSVLSRAVAALVATASLLALRPERSRSEPTNHIVRITGFRFVPDRLQARPGDSITWTNDDIAPHTATADDGSWSTGKLAKGERASLTVTPGMAGLYHCRFHPAMKAALAEVDGR